MPVGVGAGRPPLAVGQAEEPRRVEAERVLVVLVHVGDGAFLGGEEIVERRRRR